MENKEIVILFDYDSLIYKSVFRIVSIQDIKSWIREGKSREWMETEIINLAINRLVSMGDNILLCLEDGGIWSYYIEYYITSCKKAYRKSIYPQYKENRKKVSNIVSIRMRKWVSKVRSYLKEMNFASCSDKFEADDLIRDRAEELGEDNYVIVSMDKDLSNIPGLHYNYYNEVVKDENGEELKNMYGETIKEHRGFKIVSKEESEINFWTQMLCGDSGDNIPGLYRVGVKTAPKIIKDVKVEDLRSAVMEYYKEHFLKRFDKGHELEGVKERNDCGAAARKHFLLNYELLRLGTDNRTPIKVFQK